MTFLETAFLPTAREGNVFSQVSVHNRPYGYSFTARPCYGAVGTHPTGMLSCGDGFGSGHTNNILEGLRIMGRVIWLLFLVCSYSMGSGLGWGAGWEAGFLYRGGASGGPCIVRSKLNKLVGGRGSEGASIVMSNREQNDGQTRLKILPSHNFVGG